MPASMNIDQAKGKNASGPITKKRFVKLDPTASDGESVLQCNTQGEHAYGVSLFTVSALEITRGKGASVINDGRAIVDTGPNTVNTGDLVSTDANGYAKTAASGEYILGECDENGGVAGNEIGVKLYLAGAKA